jgi:DNA (cytosine-5)-methyltransferase 1
VTLGSLFDGIGGFPLAGVMCGITPVWSSEIEPFPLKVTAARFPEMKQLGSVTGIDGGAVEPVDIITFGSPCQDLSVAGKQLGIHEGQRSNLFFEAVRIIKEMRESDERTGRTDVDIRPRFAVWENVPGAFSSNKGADFKAVLEALANVSENGVSIPQPKKWGGCWVRRGKRLEHCLAGL